jgi:hypothetical protein
MTGVSLIINEIQVFHLNSKVFEFKWKKSKETPVENMEKLLEFL